MNQKHLFALLRTLRAASKAGLHASISPRDCALLVEILEREDLDTQTNPLDKITDAAGEIAHDFVDGLLGRKKRN